jgi:hypothetical protein
MAAIGRVLGLGLSVSAATAACGTASSGGATAQGDGGVDALAQEVILSTSGKHEIELDPSQVPDFAWQYDAEAPNPSPHGFMSGSGVGFLTCDFNSDCSQARVEISDFRVWLQESQGTWVLAQSGAMGGATEAESLQASTAMYPDLESNDAGTVQEVQVPSGKTYNFYVNARFQDPPGFNGNFVVAITARVVGSVTKLGYGLMAGVNWFQTTNNGAAYAGGGLGRYIVLSSAPTTVGYTNVDPQTLLADPPAQE